MEKVVCAAIRLLDGQIYTGPNHSSCLDTMSGLARESDPDVTIGMVAEIATQLAYSPEDEKFGFLTNKGRFLTRAQSRAEFGIGQSFEIRY